MYFKIVLFVISVVCFFSSCKNNEKEKIINQVRQVEIQIPIDSLIYLQPCGNMRNHVVNADYRYVVYCDSTICSLCELQRMGIWHGIIKKTNEIGIAIDFMFIFNPPKKEAAEFINGYYFYKYNLTIFVDTCGIMQKNNAILNNSALHAFILNRNNCIVKIGDASKNAEVEQEFYKFLKREKRFGE